MGEEYQMACFRVGDESFAADIMKIKEVILYRRVTAMPRAPDFMEGIINIRGDVIPVIDMRKRLGMATGEITKNSRIIILSVGLKDVGIIVDSVSKVLRVSDSDIKPAPSVGKGIESEYLTGVIRNIKDEEDITMILDMDRVLTTTEKVRLDEILSTGAQTEA